MTTKPKAKKFRIRRDAPLGQSPQEKPQAAALPPPPAARSGQVESAKSAAAETALDAIRREGLTGRQLRMARRVAQKQGIAATSDFDAVLQLRQVGVDPFQRNTILELVAPDGKTDAAQAAPQAGAPTKESASNYPSQFRKTARTCRRRNGPTPPQTAAVIFSKFSATSQNAVAANSLFCSRGLASLFSYRRSSLAIILCSWRHRCLPQTLNS